MTDRPAAEPFAHYKVKYLGGGSWIVTEPNGGAVHGPDGEAGAQKIAQLMSQAHAQGMNDAREAARFAAAAIRLKPRDHLR